MRKRLIIIVIAFCISFILMVVLSWFSLGRFNTYANYTELVNKSTVVIDNLYQTELHLRDIDRAERGYMITHDTMYVRLLNNSIDSIVHDIRDLDSLTLENEAQQKDLKLLKAIVAVRIAKVRDNVAYIDTARQPLSAYYFDSRKVMQECSRKLRQIHESEDKLRADRAESVQFYQRLTTSTLRYLLFVFCIITLILFMLMIKELRGRMLYQQELQGRIIDLKRSHSELQEIAYVASHDLQEPLRKIQVFSNMLIYQKSDKIDEDSKQTLERISASAQRMQLLISDLTSLTSLTKIDEFKQHADLSRMVHYILIDIDERVKEKNATIHIDHLPVLSVYENQLRILLTALLDNALKFTREGVPPVINMTYSMTNGEELTDINPNLAGKKFHCITCNDNGIGFDNKFINKIFQIFQRLHNGQSEYVGKGIGLAICQRIMANHEGYIVAHGVPRMGASFKLFFPAS